MQAEQATAHTRTYASDEQDAGACASASFESGSYACAHASAYNTGSHACADSGTQARAYTSRGMA